MFFPNLFHYLSFLGCLSLFSCLVRISIFFLVSFLSCASLVKSCLLREPPWEKIMKLAASRKRAPAPPSPRSSPDHEEGPYSPPKEPEMVIEQPIDPGCLADFGIVEILSDMGWRNILHFGGSACLPLVDLIYAAISLVTPDPLSFKISDQNKAI